MNEEKEERAQAFKNACNKIPKGVYSSFKEEMIREMEWGTQTFWNKMSGRHKIKGSEMIAAKVIFAKYGVTLNDTK